MRTSKSNQSKNFINKLSKKIKILLIVRSNRKKHILFFKSFYSKFSNQKKTNFEIFKISRKKNIFNFKKSVKILIFGKKNFLQFLEKLVFFVWNERNILFWNSLQVPLNFARFIQIWAVKIKIKS